MPTRRAELTREAARLFAERGFHGTSMGHLAEAMGVQKGSLYSHTRRRSRICFSTRCARARRAFHAALDGVPERRPAVDRVRLALRAISVSSRSSSTSRRCSPASGAISRAPPRGDPRRAPPLRGTLARAVREGLERAVCAPISTRGRPRCSSSRPRTGPTPGSCPAATRTSSPTVSRRPRRRHPRLRHVRVGR